MNYTETLEYLYAKLPMFTRVGVSAFKKDLNNTLKFCAHLNHPENKFKSVHVGGTNGKGSTSHMLAAILQKAGYKTGLYTSPHLKDFRERIKINGKMITEESVIYFVDENRYFIEEISPSFFEVTVALAFDYFAKEKVDIAVIEVGLGGRLDSTNVINPELAIITNISYDHMNLLGNTLAEIATEKAGIIKQETSVVIGEFQDETEAVFLNKAAEMYADIYFADKIWKINDHQLQDEFRNVSIKNQDRELKLELDLTGTYQLKNIKTVLESVVHLNSNGFFISDEHIISALKEVKQLTGLMGRWQVLEKNPKIICDTGHNEEGIKEVLENINQTPHEQLHFVIGMVKDKDISQILKLLPKNAVYYFCSPDIPRAKQVDELREEAHQIGLIGEAYQSVKEAIASAKEKAKSEDLIFIGGSTFVVAEAV